MHSCCSKVASPCDLPDFAMGLNSSRCQLHHLVELCCQSPVVIARDACRASPPRASHAHCVESGPPAQRPPLSCTLPRGPWYILLPAILLMGLPCGSDSKESACNAGDLGLERSSGEGNGYPLQYSGLENSMDRGSWWATVHGVGKIWTRLSKYNTFTFHTINRKASLFLPHFPHLQLRVQALEF